MGVADTLHKFELVAHGYFGSKQSYQKLWFGFSIVVEEPDGGLVEFEGFVQDFQQDFGHTQLGVERDELLDECHFFSLEWCIRFLG